MEDIGIVKKTLSAIFIGGDRDGTSMELKGAHPHLIPILEAASDGGLILADRIKFHYALVSVGPPLRYEISKPL